MTARSNGSENVPEQGNQLITLRQFREQLQASDSTIRRIVRNGEIPIVRIHGLIRIHPAEVEKFIKRNTERVQDETIAQPKVLRMKK